MNAGAGRQRGESHAAPRSIFQYIAIVRQRWRAALLAFLVVAGLVVLQALFATPVYETAALVRIDENRGAGQDDLAALTLSNGFVNTDAELQMALSQTVAADAAEIAGVGVTIDTENAYRPLDTLRRTFGDEGAPVRLSATLETKPLPERSGRYRVTFQKRGKRVLLEALEPEAVVGTAPYDRERGGEIPVAGTRLLLRAESGWPTTESYEFALTAGALPPTRVEPLLTKEAHKAAPRSAAFDGLPHPGGKPIVLLLDVGRRAMPLRSAGYHLEFDRSGSSFELSDAGGGTALGTHSWDKTLGARIDVAGETIQIRPVSGSPAGERFSMDLRSGSTAAQWVQGAATATEMGDYTGLFQIGAKAPDPFLAQRLANALAESYLRRKRGMREEQMISRLAWLDEEIEAAGLEYGEVLAKRDAYVKTKKAVLLGEKASAALSAQSALFEQKLAQQQSLEQEEATLRALGEAAEPGKMLSALGLTGGDAQILSIEGSLVELAVQRGAALRKGSTEQDTLVQGLDAEIAELQKLLRKRTESLREDVVAQMKRRIATIQASLSGIAEESARHQATLDALPEEERDLAELTRVVQAAGQRYAFLEQMHGETELALTSTLAQAHLIDPAPLRTARKSPVLFRTAAMAFFLGLFAAVGAALLRQLRDTSITTPADLEARTGLEVLASIPEFSSVPRKQRKGLHSSLVVRDVPSSTLAESYRTLSANVRFAESETPIQAMTFTSAVPAEGKTVTSLNVALAMAGTGNRVILIDADLRRPTANTHLELPLSPGLVDVLQGKMGWREAVQESGFPNLSFLSAGRAPADPSSLLSESRFKGMLTELRADYTFVIFDVPPALAVADAAAFFRALDAVYLVCRSGSCPAALVDGARAQIERFGGRVRGAVFNGFDARKAGSSGYGYGGYYAYQTYYGRYFNGDAADVAETDPGAERPESGA